MSEFDYSFGSKLLHQLALGIDAVAETAFDIEKAIFARDSTDVSNGEHVFVCGLARAGTTIIMRLLYQTGEFCSLTYRDMSFVLAPNLWSKIAGLSRRSMAAKERAHGDGIHVDFDSPEALEEVFWRVFCGKDYIRPHCLRVMHADHETIENFRKYISVILQRHTARRYLSKNNNNILRISSIEAAFPKALILVPFRNPIQQAYSLLKQHQHFLKLHAATPFSKRYMTWLAHHEFGGDHRPFELSHSEKMLEDKSKIEYWLAQWVGVYDHLLRQFEEKNIAPVFLGYESLCDRPQAVWGSLLRKANLVDTGVLDF